VIDLRELTADSLYQAWKKEHPEAFLSHFFSALSNFQPQDSWEIGFYDPSVDKITVFRALVNAFEIKPADDVFKKEKAEVEELKMDNVKLSFEQAVEVAKEQMPSLFPHEQLGDGFVILQMFKGKTLWNFTCISKSLKFLNIKIDAATGKVASHQAMELMRD